MQNRQHTGDGMVLFSDQIMWHQSECVFEYVLPCRQVEKGCALRASNKFIPDGRIFRSHSSDVDCHRKPRGLAGAENRRSELMPNSHASGPDGKITAIRRKSREDFVGLAVEVRSAHVKAGPVT